MLTYSPMTGLPVLGSHTSSHTAPTSMDSISFPDLLETQSAQIRLTSQSGVSSIHEVRCSIIAKSEKSYPSPDQREIVICPISHEEIHLSRPLVIHDVARSRIVFRLPESFRSRVHSVMSWWFDCLSRSSRPIIPSYAMQPVFEFVSPPAQKELEQPLQTAKAPSPIASPSNSLLPAPGEEFRVENIGPSISSKPNDLGRVTQTTSLSEPERQVLQTPLSSAPTKQVRSPKRNTSKVSAISSDALPPPPSNPAKTRLDKAPDLDDSIDAMVDTHTLDDTASSEDPGESTFLDSKGGLANVPNNPSLKAPPPSTDNLVAPIAPPSSPSSKATKAKRKTVVASNSIASYSPDGSNSIGSILDEIGTIERPALEGVLAKATNAQVPAISSEDGVLKSVLEDQKATEARVPAVSEEVANKPTSQHPSVSSQDAIAQMEDLDVDLIPDIPTVSRPMPESLAALHQENREPTAVRQMVGAGISVAPEASVPKPLSSSALSDWKRSKQAFWFETDLPNQKGYIHFLFPRESARLLNKQGRLSFKIQLHRMPTYPLIALLLIFQTAEEETKYVLQCPLDVEEADALIFLDLLMQNFELRINLCTPTYKVYRDVHVNLPLEENVEYLLSEARYWREELGDAASYKKALKQFEEPDYDLLGKMSHNFNQDSFQNIDSPSMARLASGIVSYWSDPEQFDYLTSIKSFPVNHFREIQLRVIKASLEFGIFLPDNLIQKAIELGFGTSVPELLRQLLANFAEVNLQLRHTNDLDPWDNLENWQKLFDACDTHHIEIDDEIEELAQAAQRRSQEDAEIPVESVEDFEIFEDYKDMTPSDLLDLLNDPEHRLEAAVALSQKRYTQHIEALAAIFPQLAREEVGPYCESFILLGAEAEDYLISWLPLPRAYQREAAMLALGQLGSQKAIEPIIKRLRSGEEWEIAAKSLGYIGEASLPALSKELKNKKWLIRLRAVKALAQVQSKDARKLIEKLQRDPNEVVKAEVLSILKR